MPINEEELDEIIDPSTQDALGKMEKGKWYSIAEISKLLVEKDIFEEVIKFNEKKGDITKALDDFVEKLSLYIIDLAYIESFIVTQSILGKIAKGYKDGIRHYCRI